MAHSISLKILGIDKGLVRAELSGAFEAAYGLEATVAELAKSIPYLLQNGYKQSIGDAGAMPKGTPEADVKAARRERHAALQAGYQGNQGGSRTPLWARLAAGVLSPKLVGEAKASDVLLALVRDDKAFWAKQAKAAKLDPAKVAEHVAAKVAFGKREAERQAKAAAEEAEIDLA